MNNRQRITLDMAKNEIQAILYDEEEKYDNIPENLQDSERAELMQENINNLQEAIDLLNEVG